MGRSRVDDDFRRIRLASGRRVATDVPPAVPGSPAFVGQVTSAASKIGVGQFLMVEPTYVLGAESEGGSGSLEVGTGQTVPVYLLGPGTPATGEFLICRSVDHRWVAERMSASAGVILPPVAIPDCYCPIPAVLQMISANPTCNRGMFQSCTISYQATPSWSSSLGLGPMIFLSNGSFYDQVLKSTFYYYLWCQYYGFNLTRLYPTSPYGSPYRDSVLYSWSIGGTGNTCDPFALAGGKPYPGSDASCMVTIGPS